LPPSVQEQFRILRDGKGVGGENFRRRGGDKYLFCVFRQCQKKSNGEQKTNGEKRQTGGMGPQKKKRRCPSPFGGTWRKYSSRPKSRWVCSRRRDLKKTKEKEDWGVVKQHKEERVGVRQEGPYRPFWGLERERARGGTVQGGKTCASQ